MDILPARIEAISLPELRFALPVYYILAPAEASSNLSRFDGVRYGRRVGSEDYAEMLRKTRGELLGREVIRRIMVGSFVLSEGYRKKFYSRADAARRALSKKIDALFGRFDYLLTPTASEFPFEKGARKDDPLSMYSSDRYTVIANLAGIPAISLPVKTERGLPCGMQLLAPCGHDEELLSIAAQMEDYLGD